MDARQISDDLSVVVGTGEHNGIIQGYRIEGLSIAAIPEPADAGLLAGGLILAGIFGYRRHRRRIKSAEGNQQSMA